MPAQHAGDTTIETNETSKYRHVLFNKIKINSHTKSFIQLIRSNCMKISNLPLTIE